MNQILIVEDEVDIGELLSYQVKKMGHEVDFVTSGEAALSHLNKKKYDLIILDWMLPGLSGVEIAQLIRKMDSMNQVGILMLTAKSDPESIVLGLESGADDYMTKPFDNDIFEARVKSLLRRVERKSSGSKPIQKIEASDDLQVGPINISLKTYKAFINDKELDLTPSEFKLLATMLQDRGRVLTRGRLIEEVQGEGISVIGRTIDTHVFGLRKKLGEFSNMIETVRGVGYRVKDDLY